MERYVPFTLSPFALSRPLHSIHCAARAQFRRQRSRAPVRRVFRLATSSPLDDRAGHLAAAGRRTPTTRRVLLDTRQPPGRKSPSPAAHQPGVGPQFFGDQIVGLAFDRGQDHLSPKHQPGWGASSARPSTQCQEIIIVRRNCWSDTHVYSYCIGYNYSGTKLFRKIIALMRHHTSPWGFLDQRESGIAGRVVTQSCLTMTSASRSPSASLTCSFAEKWRV
jgi:hypothetical protein